MSESGSNSSKKPSQSNVKVTGSVNGGWESYWPPNGNRGETIDVFDADGDGEERFEFLPDSLDPEDLSEKTIRIIGLAPAFEGKGSRPLAHRAGASPSEVRRVLSTHAEGLYERVKKQTEDHDGTKNKVSATDCQAFREAVAGGASVGSLEADPETDVSNQTIIDHVKGVCSHDVEHPKLEYERGVGWSPVEGVGGDDLDATPGGDDGDEPGDQAAAQPVDGDSDVATPGDATESPMVGFVYGHEVYHHLDGDGSMACGGVGHSEDASSEDDETSQPSVIRTYATDLPDVMRLCPACAVRQDADSATELTNVLRRLGGLALRDSKRLSKDERLGLVDELLRLKTQASRATTEPDRPGDSS